MSQRVSFSQQPPFSPNGETGSHSPIPTPPPIPSPKGAFEGSVFAPKDGIWSVTLKECIEWSQTNTLKISTRCQLIVNSNLSIQRKAVLICTIIDANLRILAATDNALNAITSSSALTTTDKAKLIFSIAQFLGFRDRSIPNCQKSMEGLFVEEDAKLRIYSILVRQLNTLHRISLGAPTPEVISRFSIEILNDIQWAQELQRKLEHFIRATEEHHQLVLTLL